MRLTIVVLIGICAMSAGCSSQSTQNIETVRKILELAKEDKVSGNLKVHLNGDMEAGMREGFYLSSPGSVVDGDLEFRMKNVEPSTSSSTATSSSTTSGSDSTATTSTATTTQAAK
jgi:hypothetical protein